VLWITAVKWEQIRPTCCIHKYVKWYKKLALDILDVPLLNAYELYLVQNGKGWHFLTEWHQRVSDKKKNMTKEESYLKVKGIPQHLLVKRI
jgi:hypothetical protein